MESYTALSYENREYSFSQRRGVSAAPARHGRSQCCAVRYFDVRHRTGLPNEQDLGQKVGTIASVDNIPELRAQSELIEKSLHTDYLDNTGIKEFEHVRECLRHLMKYLLHGCKIYNTNFTDDILSTEWHESELENDDLKNYKAKAEFYVRQHPDNPAIAKPRSNIPLTDDDAKGLENILWSQVGSRQDYEAEVGQKLFGGASGRSWAWI